MRHSPTLPGLAALVVLAALAASLAAHAAGTPPAARPMVLPFTADDFDRAMSEGRASHRPVFVEAWAPW